MKVISPIDDTPAARAGIKPGDIIAEIETDKATMEVEAVDEGVVSKLLVEEGAQGVKVNAVIAELDGEGETQAKSAIAASTSSRGETEPSATSAAWAVASRKLFVMSRPFPS